MGYLCRCGGLFARMRRYQPFRAFPSTGRMIHGHYVDDEKWIKLINCTNALHATFVVGIATPVSLFNIQQLNPPALMMV